MSLLKSLEDNAFFLIVAFLLAFSIYESIGAGLGTGTPIVSVVSNSMKHEYPSMGRIGEVMKNDHPPTKYFSPDIGFQRGDIILVKGAEIENLESGKRGDVIVYKSKEEKIENRMPPMIHRVIDKSSNTVETKGDANDGQVKYCIPNYGRIYQTVNRCRQGEKLIEVEKNIEQEQILGKAFMVIPKIGYAKILPSCLWTALNHPLDSEEVDLVCGSII